MTNKYPGTCRYCGGNVPVNGGYLSRRGRRWSVVHMACARKGRSQVATIRIGDKEFIRNVNGRCEDAPCCGCCKALGDDPDRIANYWRKSVPSAQWFNPDVECLVVILLNTKRRIIGHQMVSIGIADSLLVHSRELFRPAIIASANAVVMVHNDPSGDPEPSTADINITRQIVEAGKILHMPLLDHLVMGHDRYVSLARRGLLTK